MSWRIQKYVDEVQEKYIDLCVSNRDWNYPINDVITEYVDDLADKGEIEDVHEAFELIKENIDWDYLHDAKVESGYTKMKLAGMSEKDFL